MFTDWVLIADSNRGFARALQILLDEEGPCASRIVVEPEDIPAAIRPGDRPLAAICELEMGAHGGLSLIRRLHSIHRGVPVIVTTAHPGPGSRSKALDAGVSAYLVKPLDPSDLLSLVRHVMGLKRP